MNDTTIDNIKKLTDMAKDGIKFVIRLKAGNNPTIINE